MADGASSGAGGPVRERRPGDFTTDPRVVLLAGMAVVVALGAVVAAWVLLRLIALVTSLAYHGRVAWQLPPEMPASLPVWTAALPVAGAVVIGLMARYGSDKIRGHGIPEAMEAILIGQSRLQPKVAVLKPLSSAISIGTGGPFGAEGPIIMTGGAIGSLFAQGFPVSGAERKTLLVAGAAAGMTAIFGTPIAAVLLAIEVLLFEWKPRSFIPVAVAAATAAAARTLLLDPGPLFPYAGHVAASLPVVLGWLAVGVASGLAATVATGLVYGAEDAFHRLPIHWMWWPAIGGAVVGLGGLIDPAALGVGYGNIRHLLDGDLALQAVGLLLVVKAVIWAVALGSGTSGGVLAPLLILGGALGALLGHVLPAAPIGFWALLGMAAVMGGTMRAPLTATLFAAELTGNLAALPALLLACAASHTVGVLLMRRSILTEKIARRGRHIVSEYGVDPFELASVSEIMVTELDTLPASMPWPEAVAFLTDAGAHRHKSYPVVDGAGRLAGLVSRADILRWRTAPPAVASLGEAVGGTELLTGRPDEIAGRAVDRMAAAGIGRLPILDAETGRLVGLVARKDLLQLRVRAGLADRERASFLGRRVPAT